MISSQEFQAKLQAGQIQEALALAIQSASELDITTRMTEDLPHHRSSGSEYLRTKINLLTGNVENEVGKKLVTDNNNYLKLQQLHIERVADSHRLVCSYLLQLEAILTALPATAGSLERAENLPPWTTSIDPTTVAPQLPTHPALDEDFDLSVDRDGEVWEEWVEDEDFQFEAGAPQPQSTSPISILPDRAVHSVRSPLNPLPLKPIALRSASTPVNTSGWDKFAPEYIDSDAESQSPLLSSSDIDRLDDLLTRDI
ncbi:hypothetical protein [Chamaesiphon sp. OTE_8_metabat_110]|uniref:hypothetical protein n=1 Tax=Chamaesiphon sp. OTE_8_metabat_110 TaxID=2964696 RepID=UPI00286A40F4|nr:hypothetical protein [Chamaesiphon sp. OTE_8_metabat_110]